LKRYHHTFLVDKQTDKAYAVCGQTADWPLKEIIEFDLNTLHFRQLKLDETEMQLPHIDMHTTHIYNN